MAVKNKQYQNKYTKKINIYEFLKQKTHSKNI